MSKAEDDVERHARKVLRTFDVWALEDVSINVLYSAMEELRAALKVVEGERKRRGG